MESYLISAYIAKGVGFAHSVFRAFLPLLFRFLDFLALSFYGIVLDFHVLLSSADPPLADYRFVISPVLVAS